jgi:hypothetical protein
MARHNAGSGRWTGAQRVEPRQQPFAGEAELDQPDRHQVTVAQPGDRHGVTEARKKCSISMMSRKTIGSSCVARVHNCLGRKMAEVIGRAIP